MLLETVIGVNFRIMNEEILLKNRIENAPDWQIEKYKKILNQFEDIELKAKHKRYLLWLASTDNETIDTILEIVKLKEKRYKND